MSDEEELSDVSSSSFSSSSSPLPLPSVSVSKFAFAFPKRSSSAATSSDKLTPSAEPLLSELTCRLQEVQQASFEPLLDSIMHWNNNDVYNDDGRVRTCALLLGVNLPDHSHFFQMVRAVLTKSSKNLSVASLNACNHDVKDISRFVAAQIGVKRLAEMETQSRVTIILQDLEAFKADNLLNLFIQLLDVGKEKEVHFSLILGLATSVSVLQQLLPLHLLDELSIERLPVAHKATDMLASVCELIMFEQGHMRLNGAVLQLLVEIFMHHDLAVHTFSRNYKFCVADQMHRFPLAASLMDPKSRASALKKLNEDDITMLCQLRSIKNCSDFANQSSTKKLRKSIKIRLDELDEASRTFNILIRAIHSLVGDIPGAPLGKQIYSLLWRALKDDIRSLPEYTDLCSKLEHLTPEALKSKLNKMAEILKEEETDPLAEFFTTTQRLCKEVDKALSQDEKKQGISTVKLSPPKKSKMNRHALQKIMLERAKSESSSTSKQFEVIRSKIVRELFHEKLFGTLEESNPCKLPLHELMYYSNLRTARQQLVPAPRAALHSALTNPGTYLKDAEHSDVGDAYKIYQESGKLINLYDWLQAWMTLQDTQNIDFDTLHARFTRAVMTLELLGFIRSTSTSKTDHVTKMTWGAV